MNNQYHNTSLQLIDAKTLEPVRRMTTNIRTSLPANVLMISTKTHTKSEIQTLIQESIIHAQPIGIYSYEHSKVYAYELIESAENERLNQFTKHRYLDILLEQS